MSIWLLIVIVIVVVVLACIGIDQAKINGPYGGWLKAAIIIGGALVIAQQAGLIPA